MEKEKKKIERRLTLLMLLMVMVIMIISTASFALIYQYTQRGEIALLGGGIVAFAFTLLSCYGVFFRLPKMPEPKKEISASKIRKLPRASRRPKIPTGRKVFRGQGAVRTAYEKRLYKKNTRLEEN